MKLGSPFSSVPCIQHIQPLISSPIAGYWWFNRLPTKTDDFQLSSILKIMSQPRSQRPRRRHVLSLLFWSVKQLVGFYRRSESPRPQPTTSNTSSATHVHPKKEEDLVRQACCDFGIDNPLPDRGLSISVTAKVNINNNNNNLEGCEERRGRKRNRAERQAPLTDPIINLRPGDEVHNAFDRAAEARKLDLPPVFELVPRNRKRRHYRLVGHGDQGSGDGWSGCMCDLRVYCNTGHIWATGLAVFQVVVEKWSRRRLRACSHSSFSSLKY